jgi:ribonuclease Z
MAAPPPGHSPGSPSDQTRPYLPSEREVKPESQRPALGGEGWCGIPMDTKKLCLIACRAIVELFESAAGRSPPAIAREIAMSFQFFGTCAAVPSRDRDNTALAFYSADEVVLVDCSGSPYQKILKAGLDPMRVSSLIVTHRHVDHVYGIPSLAHNMGLAGRRTPLQVYALAETMKILRGFLDLFPLEEKMPYRIEQHEVPAKEGHEILRAKGFRILSTPVKHGAPNIGLRVEFDSPRERGTVVYSSDTSPCPSLIALARGADILIHEATFTHADAARAASDGHTTGYQAGDVARQAGVRRLLLCHFSADVHGGGDELRLEAMKSYQGSVEIPEELREYRL